VSGARLRAVLLDKDGTLLEFAATWAPAYRAAAQAVCALPGARATPHGLLRAAGMRAARPARFAARSPLACGSNEEIARLWARQAGLAEVATVTALLERCLETGSVAGAVPVAGADEALAGLRALGLRLGVATMDSERSARAALERLGLAGALAFLCGADSGHGCKPGAGMVEAFCAATGLAPGAVAVVGDTPHDLEMARRAGAGLAIGVLSGVGGRAELEPLADALLASVAELPAYLAGSSRRLSAAGPPPG